VSLDGDQQTSSPDPLQKHVVWLAGVLGAALLSAAATLVLRKPADVIADFVTMVLALTVVGLLEVWRERRAVTRHRDLIGLVDAAEARVYRAVEEAKIDFQTRQSEDRMALQELITRNHRAIVRREAEYQQREKEHQQEVFNTYADVLEDVQGGRGVVNATGTQDVAARARVVPMMRNKDCRG
jgi:hypothetical protein